MRTRRLVLRWVATIGALAASSPLPGDAEVVEVEIRGSQFIPDTVTVAAGTMVRWTNSERRTSHSIVFSGAGGFESERLFPGESWQHRFEHPGRYPYTCEPHPEMKGLVVVSE